VKLRVTISRYENIYIGEIYNKRHIISKTVWGAKQREGIKMKDFFLGLKEKFAGPVHEEEEVYEPQGEEYLELGSAAPREEKSRVLVRPFVMEEFEDIKEVLDVLREGSTVALINIRPLKEKDLVELKRAVSKLRKTCEAIDGDIAGFGEDYVVAVPYFARIHRNQID